jgi:ornithine cyclodeaminase/alanine dehydrogenase-like protein (mu-crystallin family)
MPTLLLRESDVRALVNMTDAIHAVETSLLEQARGSGVNSPRRRVRQPYGALHLMGAALIDRACWGFKAYTTTRQGARFLVNLYHLESGALLAILEADHLGQLRTGAASGVATRLLSRPESGVAAIFGAGFQAETQLAAIAAVRSLKEVHVFSPTPQRRQDFAARMSQTLGLPVIPVDSPEAALDGADIVTTITTASQPVFDGALLREGMHINAAGSNSAVRQELDITTIRRADLIVTDDPEQARLECGDLIYAHERNAFDWGRLRRLADVLAGFHPGRQAPQEITLFESHGIALWDIALASLVYERAVANGLGQPIQFGE